MTLFRSFSLLSLTTVLSASAQLADDLSHTPVRLDEFAIRSPREKSLTIPSCEAARAELAQVPGGTETIFAERWLRGRASTLADTFHLSAGVVAQPRFGSDEARLAIRGSGLQRTFHGRGLRVLQDGVPVNLADGGFDMQALEPLAAAYLNIWRGANALAWGGSTLGGAIDYVSHTGHDAPTRARLEIGSWGYRRVHLSGGHVRENVDAALAFTHQQQDGFRRHAEQENHRFFANIGLRHHPNAETRVFVTAVRTDSFLPGNLTWSQLNSDPRQAHASNLTLNQKRDFDLLRLATRTTVRTGHTTLDFTAAWTYKDLVHPIFQVIDQLSNDALLGITVTHAGEIAGRPHRLRAGLLFTHGVTAAANFVNTAGQRGALISSARQTAVNLEAFAEERLPLGRNIALVAGVVGAANRRRNEHLVGATPDYALDYHRIMPKLGARWDRGDVQIYANVSLSYEPPSFSETLTLNAPRFAQTATTWELGTRGQRGPVRWDLSLYHAALRHELLALDHDNNPATPAATVNADRTIHRGIEFATEIDLLGTAWEVRSTPTRRFVLRVAWTYGDFRFDHDAVYGDNRLAGLPPHLVRGELLWEWRKGWYVGPTWEWVPQKSFVDFRNTLAAASYALAGFRIGQRTERGLSWFVEARNLFDRKHAATTGVIEDAAGIDQAQFLPGDGRSFFGGIEYNW